MIFQNRKDNFEEVYFLNGNIYPLSTSERKKRVSAVEPENHLENIFKKPVFCLYHCMFLYMFECTYMYLYMHVYVHLKKIKQNKSG